MNSETDRPAGRTRGTRQAAEFQDVLRAVDGFRTAGELFDEIRHRGSKMGLATVYRYLKLFAENGSLDTVHREDGELQYRLCRNPSEAARTVDADPDDHTAHHHHVVCRVCGRSVEVEGPEVEEWAERVARAAGYTQITHTLEIFGLCADHSVRS